MSAKLGWTITTSFARWTDRARALLPQPMHSTVTARLNEVFRVAEIFNSDGIEIAFMDEGDGPPTLLIHGFGSNHRVNWVSTSWTRDLLAAGRRVIALDNRGHGESGKPHDRGSSTALRSWRRTARRLLDHLGIEKADVIGYSMGARIAASLALAHPERVRRAVFGGLGEAMVDARAVRAGRAADRGAPGEDARRCVGSARRAPIGLFADQTGSDREALVACILGARDRLTPDDVATDLGAGARRRRQRGSRRRQRRGACRTDPRRGGFTIPGRDHMKAVGDRRTRLPCWRS